MSKYEPTPEEFQYILNNNSLWFDQGIDLIARRIHIDYDVTNEMSTIIIRALLKMCETSHEPIEIYLSSYGGEAYAGLSIYDAIRSCPAEVVIIANGKVMSAAFIIFLAGDKRLAAQHTAFMMHSVSSTITGKTKDQEIEVQEAKRINNSFLEILVNRTKMSKKWWYRQILSHDKYMTTTEAFEYGLITQQTKSRKNKSKIKKENKQNDK